MLDTNIGYKNGRDSATVVWGDRVLLLHNDAVFMLIIRTRAFGVPAEYQCNFQLVLGHVQITPTTGNGLRARPQGPTMQSRTRTKTAVIRK